MQPSNAELFKLNCPEDSEDIKVYTLMNKHFGGVHGFLYSVHQWQIRSTCRRQRSSKKSIEKNKINTFAQYYYWL